MGKSLVVFQTFLVAVFASIYIYLMAELTVYTVSTSDSGLVWVIMIGGGAVLLSIAMALIAAILQPAIYLLAAIAVGIGALVNRLYSRV
ncbi:hypothetical protein [Xenorhabdus ehlersii]|uniref:Uncharacterized protein n=1 Tax=Xenorhabdus ehlersii TaxID=290111 RepID=A0A2D0IRY1_9GAMM|nr:hypothetical protein [Xenorhabdus ehlersii]PHM24580.1 hypothetical protein Xehl_01830 [Xenorhabdus ehlersii]RKE91219.1 hypothetical protein BDE27_1428 [Xenorhabdus ehlersii]